MANFKTAAAKSFTLRLSDLNFSEAKAAKPPNLF